MNEVPAYLDPLNTPFCLSSIEKAKLGDPSFCRQFLCSVCWITFCFISKSLSNIIEFQKFGSDALLQNGLRFFQNSDI